MWHIMMKVCDGQSGVQWDQKLKNDTFDYIRAHQKPEQFPCAISHGHFKYSPVGGHLIEIA